MCDVCIPYLCSKQKLQKKGNVMLLTLLLRAGMNCFNVYTCWKTWQKWRIQYIFQSWYLLSIVFYGIKFFTASVIDFFIYMWNSVVLFVRQIHTSVMFTLGGYLLCQLLPLSLRPRPLITLSRPLIQSAIWVCVSCAVKTWNWLNRTLNVIKPLLEL